MKILLTGGGTGGHITPILAVAHELKQLRPECRTIYVGERGSRFTYLTDTNQVIDETYALSAGKFRRYYGERWFRRLLDIKTNLLNIRDGLRVIRGIWQAWGLLGQLKPDVVFLKGGYVGVPVGVAAAMRHIPIVTHDSDAVPGLANRLVSRWACIHATALPATYYTYPSSKVYAVGVLLEHAYQPVDAKTQQAFKTRLGLPSEKPLLLVTGGSSGAQRLNEAVIKIVDRLLSAHPDLYVIHQAGKGKQTAYGSYTHDRLRVLEFLTPMYVYTGAADLVVTRGGANTLAELGIQGKPTIVVPSRFLAGGHQLKNAARLKEKGAAIIVDENQIDDPDRGLQKAIVELLRARDHRQRLAERLSAITLPDAAHALALLLLEQGTKAHEASART